MGGAYHLALRLGASMLLLLGALGCSRGQDADGKKAPAPNASATSPGSKSNPNELRTLERPLVESLDDCSVWHGGLLIDWAHSGPFSQGRFDFASEKSRGLVEKSGASFLAIGTERNEHLFYWPEATTELGLDFLVHSSSAERIVIEIDGRTFAELKLPFDETKRLEIKPRHFSLERGPHRIAVRAKKGRGGPPVLALSWMRLSAEPTSGSDLPPTHAETFAEVTLGKERKRSIVLREGTRVDCVRFVPDEDVRLVGHWGIWGEGKGEAALAFDPETGSAERFEQKILPQEAGKFLPFERTWPKRREFTTLRFEAPRLSRSARLVVAEPRLVSASAPPGPSPHADFVVVVALSGLGLDHFPTKAHEHGFSVLGELRKEGVFYSGYRASSTSSGDVLTSLTHRLPHYRVTPGHLFSGSPPTTLAEQLRVKGARSGFFTAVPTSFEFRGASRGFQTVVEVSPKSDVAALQPITAARQFLEAAPNPKTPTLLVMHLRGAHPPFDLTLETARELPPAEYGGDLDPRRAALQLLAVRERPVSRRILPDEDWARLQALSDTALRDQSRALTEFIQYLKRTDRWDETLFVLLGDVGAGNPPLIPFDENAPLAGGVLSVPLLVKYPHARAAGSDPGDSVTTVDVAATIAAALELPAGEGLDLASAEYARASRTRPVIATHGEQYETRLGPYRLHGKAGSIPQLCRLDLDPGCAVDRQRDEPLAHRALFRITYESLEPALAQGNQAKTLHASEETRSALTVWGVPENALPLTAP